MLRNKSLFAAAVMVAFMVGAGPRLAGEAKAGCLPTDKIDSSTAAQATKKMEAGGYRHLSNLRKGCDNYWHADAIKDGAVAHVVLSPEGQLLIEGD